MSIINDVLKAVEDKAVEKHKAPTDYDENTLKTLTELASTIPCGSALLCSGTAAESRMIEQVDGTDFSHTAMIVRFHDDQTGLGDQELYVWTADTVDKLEDQIDKLSDKKHPGTHLLKLKDYLASLDKLYPSPDGSKYRFAVARLTGVKVDEKQLWSVMYEYDGTPFPPTKQEFMHWLEGQLNINTGMMKLVTLGEADHMEGSVISDAVNLAARLEGLTKLYQNPLLISETTMQQLPADSFSIRLIDRVSVNADI